MKTKTASVWFTLIALLLPAGLFLLIEVALRIAGYGNSYPVFVPASEPSYLMPNPAMIKRYFHNGATAPKVSPDTYYFQEKKPENEVRLVMMGGSTAAGFPYGRFGSPSGLLEARLQQAYPDKTIRVISVALSSVNSYTLRDISEDILSISPDAVLIYAGHNEYLGVMGVGSVYASRGGHLANLLFLKLKNWRTFQFAQSLFASDPPDAEPDSADRTIMATIAQSSQIAFDSEIYHLGIAQFRSNLAAVLTTFSEAYVPTFISTIAANESEQRPFLSVPAPGIEDLNAFLNTPDDKRIKQRQAETAVTASPDSADAHFALATMLTGTDDKRAYRHFVYAMDNDQLRFRAPSVFNAVIRDLARQHQASVVETHQLMRAASEGGHIGYNLMLEHLHPNERGYFLLANAFYDALQENHILPAPTISVTDSEAWLQRPLTPVDSLLGKLKIDSLTSDYPFTETPAPLMLPVARDKETAFAIERFRGTGLLSQLPQLITYYQQQDRWQDAANAATALASALPFNPETAQLAAQITLRAGQPGRAWFFARQAVSLQPDDLSYQLTLAESQFKAGHTKRAITQLQESQSQFPDNPKPAYFLKQLGVRE
ncbi:CDC27 family protein [Alteromonas sp. H39]|uniref:CDC27 family protein n=1 Tax=Alteromonas sp. H39 TaxID=3389876 RepID=UPI0039E19BBC